MRSCIRILLHVPQSGSKKGRPKHTAILPRAAAGRHAKRTDRFVTFCFNWSNGSVMYNWVGLAASRDGLGGGSASCLFFSPFYVKKNNSFWCFQCGYPWIRAIGSTRDGWNGNTVMLNVLGFPVKVVTNFSIIIFRLKVKYGQFQK